MRNGINTNRSIVVWSSIVLGYVALLSPAVARAECKNGQLSMRGDWVFQQSNGISAEFHLGEYPSKGEYSIPLMGLKGSASYHATGSPSSDIPQSQRGDVEGTLKTGSWGQPYSPKPGQPARILLNVYWNDGTVGEYEGRIDTAGVVSGSTYDKNHPESKAVWHANRLADCVEPERCPSGMVWRESFDGDTVCVSPDDRYRLLNGTCRSGYVWRERVPDDKVCVTPAERDAVQAQKRRDELGVVTDRPGAAVLVNPPQDNGVVKRPPSGFNPNR